MNLAYIKSWYISLTGYAFFPFIDGIEQLIESGVKAIIQPGGSVNDNKAIKAANDAGITMVFTSTRHFKH